VRPLSPSRAWLAIKLPPTWSDIRYRIVRDQSAGAPEILQPASRRRASPRTAAGQGRRCRPPWRTAAVPSIADELTTAGTAVGPGQQAGSITERLVGSFWDRSAVFQRSTANNHGQAHERRVMTPVGVAKPSSVLIHFSRHQPYSGVQSSKRQLMPSSCSRSCRDAGKRNWKVALWAPHLSS
jgi:hypothetical protein